MVTDVPTEERCGSAFGSGPYSGETGRGRLAPHSGQACEAANPRKS
jgi:hypothetical protein